MEKKKENIFPLSTRIDYIFTFLLILLQENPENQPK